MGPLGERAGRGERKRSVLELVEARGEVTAAEVADALGLSLSAASESLRRYHRQGDLRRRLRVSLGMREYVYTLSDKGQRKLAFLREQVEVGWQVESEVRPRWEMSDER